MGKAASLLMPVSLIEDHQACDRSEQGRGETKDETVCWAWPEVTVSMFGDDRVSRTEGRDRKA